jgi:TRAP-type mannitol/chloroaromatic compound transport system permease large subunit
MGNGAAFVVSVGDLFGGALIPGFILVGCYLAYVAIIAFTKPDACPPVHDEDSDPLTAKEVIFGLGAPLVLIIAVLGAILGGVASPTQAASIGAAGAVMLAGLRLSESEDKWLTRIILAGLAAIAAVVILRNLFDLRMGVETIGRANMIGIWLTLLAVLLFSLGVCSGFFLLKRRGQLMPAMKSAVEITSMVFLILIGASLFSLVFRGFGGDEIVADMLHAMPGGKWGALLAAMLVMFVLGFFLDFIEIVFVVVPLVTPPLIIMGFDPVWLAILMALNLQTSFLTPPFGFALFYLRGVAPADLPTRTIYKGVIPFIVIQVIILVLLAFFPELATWLPDQIYG